MFIIVAHTNICATCNNAFETSDPGVIYCSIQCAN